LSGVPKVTKSALMAITTRLLLVSDCCKRSINDLQSYQTKNLGAGKIRTSPHLEYG